MCRAKVDSKILGGDLPSSLDLYETSPSHFENSIRFGSIAVRAFLYCIKKSLSRGSRSQSRWMGLLPSSFILFPRICEATMKSPTRVEMSE